MRGVVVLAVMGVAAARVERVVGMWERRRRIGVIGCITMMGSGRRDREEGDGGEIE